MIDLDEPILSSHFMHENESIRACICARGAYANAANEDGGFQLLP
jgi:hypothetical protein